MISSIEISLLTLYNDLKSDIYNIYIYIYFTLGLLLYFFHVNDSHLPNVLKLVRKQDYSPDTPIEIQRDK